MHRDWDVVPLHRADHLSQRVPLDVALDVRVLVIVVVEVRSAVVAVLGEARVAAEAIRHRLAFLRRGWLSFTDYDRCRGLGRWIFLLLRSRSLLGLALQVYEVIVDVELG